MKRFMRDEEPGGPRLEIDGSGHASVVFPPKPKRAKHVRGEAAAARTREVEKDQVVVEHAEPEPKPIAKAPRARQDFLREMKASLPPVHLRIGEYPESYERTRLPAPPSGEEEEDLDVRVDADADVAVAIESTVQVEDHDAASPPSSVRRAEDDLVIARAGPQPDGDDDTEDDEDAQDAKDVEEVEDVEDAKGAEGVEDAQEAEDTEELEAAAGQEITASHHQPQPAVRILPSILIVTKADPSTRVRYAVQLVTVKGEVFVRQGPLTLLPATYGFANHLMIGPNETVRREPFSHWGPSLGLRPDVLHRLFPKGQWEYTPENGRRKKAPVEFRPQLDRQGRILLSASHRPLKHSDFMPWKVSTEIEGWEMEALCRLDPDLCYQDFVDRMVPVATNNASASAGGTGQGNATLSLPSKGTLNHRRRRDRMRMRILPWPTPSTLSYSDRQILRELTPQQLKNNTTVALPDLTREQMDMQCAIMYGGHLERSGGNAQTDAARLETFRANLALVRTKFAESSEEVRLVKGRIAVQLEKMNLQYDHSVWDV